MRFCVFEDRGVDSLAPLTLTRPAFDLLCGSASLLQRQARALGTPPGGALVRTLIAERTRRTHAALRVNDLAWLSEAPTVLVNARWLPDAAAMTSVRVPSVGVVDEEIAYVATAADPQLSEVTAGPLADWLGRCFADLPHVRAGGTLVAYPWQLIEHNAELLRSDVVRLRSEVEFRIKPSNLAYVGPGTQVFVHESAHIDPFVAVDCRNGPVIIDRNAVIQSFTRLEGPCYVGRESWLLGAKLRGGTIGPRCRIGGEVEASIVHGYSNKYHDGFLGHSYVGEWVNLAAGTQTSDLRNDYGIVHLRLGGAKVATGLTKVGTFFGDHTRTGLGTLLNTGSAIGAFCNLLPSASLLPQEIPSFCQFGNGQLQERRDLQQICTTSATVVGRRQIEWTQQDSDFLHALFDQTALHRRRVLQEYEQRRLKRCL